MWVPAVYRLDLERPGIQNHQLAGNSLIRGKKDPPAVRGPEEAVRDVVPDAILEVSGNNLWGSSFGRDDAQLQLSQASRIAVLGNKGDGFPSGDHFGRELTPPCLTRDFVRLVARLKRQRLISKESFSSGEACIAKTIWFPSGDQEKLHRWPSSEVNCSCRRSPGRADRVATLWRVALRP